jgi:ribonuclease Y
VVVDAARVPDERAPDLAREIAKAVEEEMAYPGEIRVSVFRETRATHYAR